MIFEKGDVVQLKSGGQKMTVEGNAYDPHNKVYLQDKVDCTWFIGSKLMRESFFTFTLKKV